MTERDAGVGMRASVSWARYFVQAQVVQGLKALLYGDDARPRVGEAWLPDASAERAFV